MSSALVNINNNFEDNQFIFDGNIIEFDRIYCGVSGNTAVIIGEENFRDTTNYYCLADIQTKRFNDLIKVVQNIKTMPINEYFGKLTKAEEDILSRHHLEAFRSRSQQVFITRVLSNSLVITSEIEAVQSTLKPKRLYFFNASRVPAEFQSLPTDITKVKAEEYPLVASLGYAITQLLDIDDSGYADMNLTSRRY